jgi:outer membrane protein OmpA-like peptidoglycan-associated protein
MKIKTLHSIFALLILSAAVVVSAQQQNLRETLFAEADAALNVAKRKLAYMLAPRSFDSGYKLYKQAEESLAKGRNLATIQRDLSKAIEFLEKSVEASKLGEVTFASTLKARDDARKADSLKYSPDLWKNAELKFRDAASNLERGDVKSAQRGGAQAEKLYRDAELDAIKANYLNETKTLLAQAEDMKVQRFAPKTLQKAKTLLANAERALTENRYDIDQPRDLARQAKYEANHAIYLAKRVSDVRDKDISIEDLILDYETPLISIGGAANIVTELDRGHEIPTREIIAYIETLQEQSSQMKQDLADMETKLGGLASERVGLKRLETQRRQAERVESMFTREEASVLRRGDEIIVRLIGLNFAVNKAEIESKNFSMLTKVQSAIKVFPDSKLLIEGHTDSFGSDNSNLALSQRRAESVRQYIIANMSLSPNLIRAVGYGEARPVASNETPEGRAKNRRIDIVIRPAI